MTYIQKNKKLILDVLKLALPAAGEMSLYMIVWTVDTAMVGRFGGDAAISAVGIGAQFMYTFVDILVTIGVAVALTSLISRLRGAREIKRAEEVAVHGIIISVIIAAVTAVLFILFKEKILGLYDAQGEVLSLGVQYFKIASIAIFFNMILSALNGVYRGMGNTKVPFVSAFVLMVTNLILDYLLIFGINGHFRLGVKGAALATLIANVLALGVSVAFFKRNSILKLKGKYIKTLSFKKLKEILFLAIPSGMQEGAFSICRLINSMMIAGLGQAAFAANQIAVSIESISFMPGWGVAVAATSLVGFKVGEKDYKEARRYCKVCLIIGSIFMGLCGLMFLIVPGFIARLFIGDNGTAVVELAKICIMIAAIEQIPTAISMILGGALKGMGDTKIPFKVALFSNWIIRMPLMIIAVPVLKLDISFVWWITSIQWTADAIMMIVFYRKKMSGMVHSGEAL